MKTEWVRVCVRPEQSFTRAILEIYMADGGSLSEVITALRYQKQFRIKRCVMVRWSVIIAHWWKCCLGYQ